MRGHPIRQPKLVLWPLSPADPRMPGNAPKADDRVAAATDRNGHKAVS